MTYSDKLTNRELVQRAMPLVSLSRKQWGILLKHIEEIERSQGNESEIFKALETVHNNQARIEVMNNYYDYYGDVLEDGIRDCSIVGVNII